MGRVTDIITRARDTLADPLKTRWTDARLLRILDEGQKQIVLNANLLRTKATLSLIPGVAEYNLPEDCFNIIRVTYKGVSLPIMSHEELDDYAERGVTATQGQSWETAESTTVEAFVFDKINFSKYKLYPIPIGSAGSMTLENVDHLGDANMGLIISASGYLSSGVYGLISELVDDGELFTTTSYNLDITVDSNYGFTVMFDDNASDITLYYLKRPTTLTVVSDNLEIDEVWDMALKYYVTGMALRDDKDTQNRLVGNEELAFFATNLKQAMSRSSMDSTATRTQFNSPYIGGI